MNKLKEVKSGDKYGRLTIVEEAKPRKYGAKKHRRFICKCDCGNEKEVFLISLSSGRTKSCGCLVSEKNSTHGLSGKNSYKLWCGVRQRCLNSKNRLYKNYGGRGIKICERWLKFENFYEDMGDKPDGKSLDRIDNDGDYCPENCRWATDDEQANNRRGNVRIKYDGDIDTLANWCRRLDLKYTRIKKRFESGWEIDRLFKN